MSTIPDGAELPSGNTGLPASTQVFHGIDITGRNLSLRDEKEMLTQRGFTLATLKTLRFFSVTAEDLPALGVTVPFDKLASTIAVPYCAEHSNGLTLARIHKTSAEGFQYPPYMMPVPPDSNDIVIVESEIKAAMVFQLGDMGIGLQGTHSFLKRVPVLANTVRTRVNQGAIVYVLPDHERLVVDGRLVVYEPTIQMIRLAHGLSLDLGCSVKMITLPDKFMEKARTHTGEPKIKADLDGCVAKGMTQDEWRKLKTEAKLPWELDIPVDCIVAGMAAANVDEFLIAADLKPRLAGVSVDDSCAVCRVLAGVLAKKCGGEDGSFDKAKFELYKKSAVEWAKKNGLKNVTTKTFQVPCAGKGDTPSEELIAHCMRETERGVVLVKRGCDTEVIAPFLLESCTFGNVYHLGSERRRRYQVKIKRCSDGKTETRVITLDNNLFDAEQYTKAQPDLVVADPKRFKMYAGEKLQAAGFQRHDPALDSPLFVGVAMEGVRAFALPHTKFPRGDQDCYYNGAKLSDSGDANTAFLQIAAISPPMDVAFSHSLGAPLKAMFGAYPHASWIGDASAAKSTIAAEICARTGFAKVAAQEQLTSRYRQLRIFGNHNIPVFVEEAHRLPVEAASGSLSVLNTAYNGAYCTHGPEGQFFIAGCAVLLGQDHAFDDEAFETKQVVVHFEPEQLNAESLKNAKANRTAFPIAKWLEFLAAASGRAQAILNERTESLRAAMVAEGVNCTGAERTLFNYACVLTSAQLLREFGVNVEIGAKITSFCRFHLAGKLHAGDEHPTSTSCAERFIHDVLEAVTTTRDVQNLSGNIDTVPEKGVWLRLTPVFDYLKRRNPVRYDVRDAARMGECIRRRFQDKGVTSGNKHKFGNARKDALFLPAALCTEMGVELLKPDDAGAEIS